jgi:hypothetical protein
MGLADLIAQRRIAERDIDGDPTPTELAELDVTKVAGVGQPANGTPFLFIKSEAESQSALIDMLKSECAESDGILAGVSGEEVEDAEDEGQSRHPATGQFITDEELEELEEEAQKGELDAESAERLTLARIEKVQQRKGTNMRKTATHINASAAISRLEKAIEKSDDPEAISRAQQVIAHHRLTELHTARGALAKGAAQDALGGTNTPKMGGHFDSGMSGVSGSVTQGVRTPASDSALSLGGQTTSVIPAEERVNTNGGLPVAGDGAGIVNPGAVKRLEKQYAKATNPIERARLGEELTLAKLTMFHTARAAGVLGGANNGGELTAAQIRPTGVTSASDIGAVGRDVLPQYLAKRAKKTAKKKRKTDKKLKKAARRAINSVMS